jgi:hypothetical protein
MTRPRLLDAFCGAGGATRGYQQAGFRVFGVDIAPQPNYVGDDFQQGDALDFIAARGAEFDAIHASPPCQHYARVTRWRGDSGDHPDLVAATRTALEQTGRPWVIENVLEAPIRRDTVLCGSMFGLSVRRHRAFETSWRAFSLMRPCGHRSDDLAFMHKGERAYADALGCGWMTAREGREAIPPAFTAYVGEQLLAHLGVPA